MGSTQYSYSRVESFEKCRLQYKYRYIDNIRTELETIEAFMGSQVHDALKEFYDFVKNKVIKPREWLLARYEDLWQKNYTESIKVVNKELTAETYFRKGRAALSDYYDEYAPFGQAKVVKTEEAVSYCLQHGGQEYPFYGIIDRLDWNDREKIFEIHDYKTSGTLITQTDADQDLQLALYQLAVQSRWPEAKKVKLVWHYLQFNKQIESWRTEEDLAKLQEHYVLKIKDIEVCQEFPPQASSLCEWCGYQEICPLWAHPKKMEKLDVNEYKRDPGVQLVQKYANLEKEKQELKEKIAAIEGNQAKIAEAAVELAERENIRVIDGPSHQLLVTIKEEINAPLRKDNAELWEKLRSILIREHKYEDVSTVNTAMLNKMLRTWPADFLNKIKGYLVKKTTKKVELRKKN